MKLVLGVVGSIVPTKNDIALNAVNVSDEEVGDGCAVRNELGANSLGRDFIFAVGQDRRTVACNAGSEGCCREEGCQSSELGEHGWFER